MHSLERTDGITLHRTIYDDQNKNLTQHSVGTVKPPSRRILRAKPLNCSNDVRKLNVWLAITRSQLGIRYCNICNLYCISVIYQGLSICGNPRPRRLMWKRRYENTVMKRFTAKRHFHYVTRRCDVNFGGSHNRGCEAKGGGGKGKDVIDLK